jgi:hypothetical protein
MPVLDARIDDENAIPVPAESAPNLAEMQAAFQSALMQGDDGILDEITDSSRTNRNVLFGVYRHAYVSRLVDIISNDHPLLRAYLGDDAFEDLARSYVAACPSRTQNARWFSHQLPEFIRKSSNHEQQVAELSELERALNDAFDAPDDEPLTLQDLAEVAPELWSDLVFRAHPSARCLAFSTNAHALWLALKNDEPPPAVEMRAGRENILVWRQRTTPMVRRMPAEEAMMWAEAMKAVPFGRLCELVAIYDDPDTAPLRAAQHLQGWIVAGLLLKTASQD